MPNKKINQLDTRVGASLTDLILIGDPGTGTSYKITGANFQNLLGLLTSVGVSMPSAFNVSGSPLTSNGTIAITGAGTALEYIAGDGSLVAFPTAGQAGTLVREVRNTTGETLTKGTIVYISGASGNKPTVSKAIATGDSTSAQTFGVIQSNLSNNSNGYAVVIGDITGLDTSAFTEGAQLYLSSTVAGTWTTTKQYAPAHLVYIGVVTRSHVNQGQVEVKIQNGYEADEIHDFAVRNPLNNDGIFFNTTTSLWEKKSIATALGYTPVPTTRTLTINGTAYDLSADRSWTVSGTNIYTADGTLTGNRTITSGGFGLTFTGSNTASAAIARGLNLTHTLVAAANNDVLVGLDINPTFTNGAFTSVANIGLRVSNSYLVVAGDYFPGTILPSKGLVFEASGGSARISSRFGGASAALDISSSGTNLQSNVTISGNLTVNGTNNNFFQFVKVKYTLDAGGIFGSYGRGLSGGNDMVLYAVSGRSLFISAPTIRFTSTDEATEWGRFFSTGNFLIQTGGTFSDSGYKLDVQGTARVSGKLSINTPTQASAVMEITSTTQGFLPPRLTTTQKNAIASPAAGLMVYDTTLNKLCVYTTAWETITSI